MTQAQSARPTGTVTFLFSDIEGSTGRWEAEPEAMREAVGRHDALLHDVFASGGGYVFKTVGDAFCVAFGDPLAAFRAALAAQQRLADEAFEAVGGLRVRIGMHTGAADERDGDYFGPTVNRVARLSDAGHGGQILVSGITAELVRDARLPGVTLLELGEYRLRDLAAPERIFQACGQGLERAFPPLRTGGAVRSNLPATPSSFVGRARELALIAESLEAHRLVTITGAGGVGKTRLALAAAAPLVPTFSGGVWFVDLSPLASPAVVIDEFAAVLGIRPSPGASLLENLAAALRTRHALLVVDNCEHVIDAAAACVAHLLRHCPNVHVLATSREALQVAGERQVTLAPLEVPEREPVADAGDALAYSAVALLVERATAAGRFALSDANAGAVAEIARRLDGIPFALELAAPRLAVISPAKLLALLAEPLRLLRNERRGSEGRATTLRAMIEWSYRLLSEDERSLFRRLAVLAGTFSIDTLVVLGPEHGGGAAFDVLASLVAKSMVVTQGEDEDGEQRFRLFESTRAFALEQLVAEGEREATERCFVAGISDAVRQRAKSLYTLGERHWLDGIERDFDNVRAALELAFGPLDDAEAGAEIAVSLGFFWHARRPQEGKHWLRRTRERADAFPQSLQARVFLESARVDVASANVVEFSERAVDGYRAAGDAPGLARALEYLGQSLINLGRSADAVAVLDESVALGEGAAASARSRALRGVAALLAGFDTAAAARDLESALPALTGAGRTRDASLALRGLAWLAGVDGRYDEALESAGRALALCESLHDPRGMALLHNELAFWYLRLERLADARANALEALRLAQNAEIPLTFNAIVLAGTLALGGRPRGAARALGFVDRPDPVSLLPFVTRYRSDIVQVLRARLGDEAFEAEAHSGDALSAAGLLRLFEEENAAPSVSGAV